MPFLAYRLNESRQGAKLARGPQLVDRCPYLRAARGEETASPIVVTDVLRKGNEARGRTGGRDRKEKMRRKYANYINF